MWGNPHPPTEQPTETIKPVGVCNDINFNNILNRRPASSASNADKNRGHTNFTNILNHRQASTASNADKNRGHRIDGLLCQITGNNDAEMGVEGDLTAVYITEYITTGNTDESSVKVPFLGHGILECWFGGLVVGRLLNCKFTNWIFGVNHLGRIH